MHDSCKGRLNCTNSSHPHCATERRKPAGSRVKSWLTCQEHWFLEHTPATIENHCAGRVRGQCTVPGCQKLQKKDKVCQRHAKYPCSACGRTVVFDDVVLKRGKSERKKSEVDIRKHRSLCVSCRQSLIQERKSILKNKQLTAQFDRDKSGDLLCLRTFSVHVDVRLFVKNHFGKSVNIDHFPNYNILPVRVVILPTRKSRFRSRTHMMQNILGGKVNKRDFSSHPNVMRRSHEEVLLILFPRERDFLAIFPSGHSIEDIVSISLSEMDSIENEEMAKRYGAAGGVKITRIKSTSLSPVTRGQEATLFASGPAGVNMSVAYRNDAGKVQYYGSVYNDLYMKRLSKSEKRKEAKADPVYRRILTQEMRTRIFCEAVLAQLDFPLFSVTGKWLQPLHQLLRSGFCFEDALLEWSLSTGEMRNHQACHAHEDGNRSAGIECLSLFGRVLQSMSSDLSMIDLLRNMQDGYLYFPIDGVVARLRCGLDTVHCSLENTLHVADNSRDKHNWSRVHGPKY